MSYFNRLYLRIFKGYWQIGTADKLIVELNYAFRDDKPEFINVNKDLWLVSPKQTTKKGCKLCSC